MIEKEENEQTISIDELRAGDVFLCRVQKRSSWKRLKQISSLLYDVLKYLEKSKPKEFNFPKHVDLIEFAIAVFDQNIYFHAAYFDGKQIIEEDLTEGIKTTKLEEYRSYPSDVIRYKNDAGVIVGEGLPWQPLNDSADTIFKRIKDHKYGYENALVLIALCIVRMAQGPLIDGVEKSLIAYFKDADMKKAIKKIFKDNRQKIGYLIDKFARDHLRHYFDDKKMVCSQFVAAVFNEAGDQKAYKITKPSHVKTMPPNNQPVETAEDEDHEKLLQQISGLIEKLPYSPTNQRLVSKELEMIKLSIDTMYTPADFVGSPNMIMLGLLKFP